MTPHNESDSVSQQVIVGAQSSKKAVVVLILEIRDKLIEKVHNLSWLQRFTYPPILSTNDENIALHRKTCNSSSE
ncbi:hypothetical protein KIN20_005844 [Parelaphostrongylus tenuis]|uniref:Uncharacterized protein n=1 Tax=Parelaphostrongylus tenuis TaxID=148309 RepID=A0AAD5QIX5_PARTN|nr:hypothetical protein KIN20_005844 [Parelaphostrongylus tenuis]